MREKRVKKGALWLRSADGCEDSMREATHSGGTCSRRIVWTALSVSREVSTAMGEEGGRCAVLLAGSAHLAPASARA